jgi:hypothetical protein
MRPALLLSILLPLLLGGCGEKESVTEVTAVEEKQQEVKPEEPVAETKPTEAVSVSPHLEYETEGDAVTITRCHQGASGALIIPATIEGKPVTSIGMLALYGCKSLTNITIPDSVTSIGDMAFELCQSLTSITIPDGVTSIVVGAFSSCSSLTSITIPDSVTSIGGSAFAGCNSLTSITIGNGVTRIGFGAFHLCSNLTSITIPDSVTSIGHMAFSSCGKLTAVTFLGDAPKDGGEVFTKTPSTIYRNPEAKNWGETWGGQPVKLISEKP